MPSVARKRYTARGARIVVYLKNQGSPSTRSRRVFVQDDGARRAARNLKKEYEKACPSSWVKHFDKKREEDNKLKRLLETRADAAAAAAAAAASKA